MNDSAFCLVCSDHARNRGAHVRLVNTRTVPGSAARRQIWGIVRVGAAIFNLGYWLWIFDQWSCSFLGSAREAIYLPWGFVLELHGCWHICKGQAVPGGSMLRQLPLPYHDPRRQTTINNQHKNQHHSLR
ncbi:ceramidase-domain-containing protein, partial [Aspergillus stella-maris]|uniref:ceramidase-domain-containing protein n=1 Tax=Aspergillus stella-maris TaxID=1810926 RepID=UPI003CCE3FA0